MFDRISIDRDGDERQFIADTATKILIAMLAGRHSPAEKNVNDYVRLSYEAAELLLEQIYKRPLKKAGCEMSKRSFTPAERKDIQRVVALWVLLLSKEHNSELADDLAMVARKTYSVLFDARKESAQTPADQIIERLLVAQFELFMADNRDEVSRINTLRASAGLPKY